MAHPDPAPDLLLIPALSDAALTGLEERLERAFATGELTGLTVLGFGEISTALRLETAGGALACKRLPPFDGEARLTDYRALFDRYLADLRDGGVHPVPSRLEVRARPDGTFTAWCLQPALAPETLLVPWLRQAPPEAAARVFDRLLDAVAEAVGPRRGVDAQLSNWALVEDRLLYLDVTTPLLREADGTERLDTGLFLASLPWALRGAVRRFFLGDILDKYYVPRAAVLDLLGNMLKEDLEPLLPRFLDQVAGRFQPAITEAEVRRYYREDARMWALLQRLRRLDRWWQWRVRRRPYPVLLPGPIRR